MHAASEYDSSAVRIRARALVTVVALAALSLACGGSSSSGTSTSSTTELQSSVAGAQVAQTEPVAQGMTVFVDPATGKITTSPDAATLRDHADAAELQFDSSGAGLVPQQLPDGSVMVDLQGRFRSASVATVGSAEIECQSNLPKPDAKSDRKED